ncbi:MAG TPA: hypothetical protein VE999_17100 [Gemmataceae bacterium]|nr:hypothetical protein [Gemmataceae bacterium]
MAMNETGPTTEASGIAGNETRIHQVAETVREVAKEIAEDLPPREWVANTFRTFTIQAPLQSLAIAFLLGVIVTRSRR